MRRYLVFIATLAVACNNSPPIKPEPILDGGEGGSSNSSTNSASSSGAGGNQGAGGSTACGDCANISGSRLKLTFQAGADGAVTANSGTWFDTSIQAICSTTNAPDGTRRCLPISDGLYVVGQYFQDAACTIRLAQKLKCQPGPVPKYATEFKVDACGLGVYHIYTAPSNWNGTIYTNSAGSCAVAAPGPIANYEFYSVGPEANYGSFVAITESHE